MDSEKEIYDLNEIFTNDNNEKFLIHFNGLIKNIDKSYNADGKRIDINEIVEKITENLLKYVELSNFKYEKLLSSKILWKNHLYNNDDNRLNIEILMNFLCEYIKIYPNRCEKFLSDYIPILFRGDQLLIDVMKVNENELKIFMEIKKSMKLLNENIRNFENILIKLIKKHYPFIHNSSTHEFVCYAFNIINLIDLFSSDNSIDLLDFLFMKLLEIDIEQLYDEFIEQNKENNNNMIEIDFNTIILNDNDDSDKHRIQIGKKLKIFDSILNLLFDKIEECLQNDNHMDDEISNNNADDGQQQQQQQHHPKWNEFIKIVTNIFLQRILSSNSIHCQYLIFYICSQSEQYCDILVNDLWIMLSSNQTPIAVRKSCIMIITSLFINGRFININSIFSLLKLILQSLNNYLLLTTNQTIIKSSSSKETRSNLSENDLIYYELCIGFCQLFCIFHNDFNRNQIDCLKLMDMKRIILSSPLRPLQYLSNELLKHFVHLCNYYRIGYININDMQQHNLNQIFQQYYTGENRCFFGNIYLKSIKKRIEMHVNDMEKLTNGTNENSSYQIYNNQRKVDDLNYRQQKAMTMLGQSNTNFNGTSTATSDDGMTSENDGSYNDAKLSNFIMNQMLSEDCEMTD